MIEFAYALAIVCLLVGVPCLLALSIMALTTEGMYWHRRADRAERWPDLHGADRDDE